jgi:hypothetical protein
MLTASVSPNVTSEMRVARRRSDQQDDGISPLNRLAVKPAWTLTFPVLLVPASYRWLCVLGNSNCNSRQ